MEDGFSLSNLTVLELQQECKRRGLKKSGVKAKLIQRLAEYIEKYGADYIEKTEKVTPVVEPSVEKSVLTIHNAHPYMEEYEEQLIKSVSRKTDVNNYFTSKKKPEVKHNDDVETPDSDAPIPYPAPSDSHTQVPSADTPDSDVPYVENPDDEAQVGSPTYPATRNSARNPRDMAEELTEPIHKSPTYCKSPNGRIVELPEENNENTAMCDEEVDAERKEDVTDEVDRRAETDPHEDGAAPHDDDNDEEMEDDVNEALHTEKNTEVEAGDASDYADAEDENGEEEMHDNEPEDYEEDEEVNEVNEENEENEENGEMEQEEETVEKEDDADIEDYDDGDNDNYDERDRENYVDGDKEDDVDGDNEDGVDGDNENEDDVDGENGDYVGDNGNDDDGDNENYADGDNEDYVEEQEESMQEEIDDEARSIEDGEITINVENQNDFEERQSDDRHSDDHLDVSVQDEKITEDNEAEDVSSTPKLPKKTVVPVTLKKRISLVASTDSPAERAAKRKRRWGSTSTSMRQSDVAISSESIKKLIPDMKIDAAALESVPELDYHEDDTNENITETPDENAANEDADAETVSPPKIFKVGRSVKVDKEKKITLEKPTSTNLEVVTVESESDAVTPSTPVPPPPKPSVRNYVIDDEIEVQEEREKSPSPAKNAISLYIHIQNLVRPYTISQLKAVVGRTGHICEGGFWINNIKSQCYVKLSTELEAAATRDALHGLRWPAGSPKLLKIDFAVGEQMYKETTGLLGQKPKVVIEIDDNQSDQVVITDERSRGGSRREDNNHDRRRKRIPPPTKEIEKEKEKEKKDPEREESPAKLLDDLFRKTKATPCIYWLPLTDDQIVKLEESRR